ncbi:necrosis inducing-like protein NPP1 type [Phytophthora cinnamomi]|uniref:necrosis inducing-like protein NPP1 type n=1 Tax=Phytophthora cinnamomi TaxID=4785 RepID=UPI00355A2921|nr:necrosis inducing-like protein NPP1 type [Phytophthora cinnamomi]
MSWFEIDDPAADNSIILGVSVPTAIEYQRRSPLKAMYVDGSSMKVDLYKRFWAGNMALKLTVEESESQGLITWEQMTAEARTALSEANYDKHIFKRKNTKVPFKDGEFTTYIAKA